MFELMGEEAEDLRRAIAARVPQPKARRQRTAAERAAERAAAAAAAARSPRRLRRSTRVTGGGAVGGAARKDWEDPDAVALESSSEGELTWVDEPGVLSYVCAPSADAATAANATDSVDGPLLAFPVWGDENADERGAMSGVDVDVVSFRCSGTFLADGSLSKAYSLDARGGLVAAAGHGGRAAIWGVGGLRGGAGAIEPLVSARLTRGWISDVRLVGSPDARTGAGGGDVGGGDAPRSPLLAASNDGVIGLWDVGRVCVQTGEPRKVWEAAGLHAGGVFSMDAARPTGGEGEGAAWHVATASKDGSALLTRLLPWGSAWDRANGGLAVVRRWEDAHGGLVVRSARLRPGAESSEVATAGADGGARVWDARSASDAAALELGRAAEGGASGGGPLSFAEWGPAAPGGGTPGLVATAGASPAVRVWDVRSPSAPLATLLGHCLPLTAKGKQGGGLYRPAFAGEASRPLVVCSGPGSDRLSCYDASSGACRSRGELGYTPTGIWARGGVGAAPVLCATTRAVEVLIPVVADGR